MSLKEVLTLNTGWFAKVEELVKMELGPDIQDGNNKVDSLENNVIPGSLGPSESVEVAHGGCKEYTIYQSNISRSGERSIASLRSSVVVLLCTPGLDGRRSCHRTTIGNGCNGTSTIVEVRTYHSPSEAWWSQ